MAKLLCFTFQQLRTHAWALGLCTVTGMLCVSVAYRIVWPAYKNPIARMYTSKIGYSSVIRKTGGAFPVTAAEVQSREIVGKFIGEGLVQSEPIQVPMIGMARILKVHVTEGQRVRKGEVIVELDASRVRLKIESAKAALQTARAELDRVRLGTVNVLQEERPDILAMRAEAAIESASVADQLLQIANELAQTGSISKMELAEAKLESIRANLLEKERKLAVEMATSGRKNSLEIGESAIREAEMTLAHRLSELDDYTSLAPADGIVERVLVHEGEYNQDPGRPAVLLASGLWFECYLDQTALNRVKMGDDVEVRLSAYQDNLFQGKIERVRPLVNFALGGPETNRPIRPLGTGAPEWPATFAVRILIQEDGALIVPGLTGYATVIQKRTTLSVPRGTVMGVSGHRGIVFVIDAEGNSFTPRNVVTGLSDNHYIEITEGLNQAEIVIADGYQVLKPGDRIAIKDGFEPNRNAAFIGLQNVSLGAEQNVALHE